MGDGRRNQRQAGRIDKRLPCAVKIRQSFHFDGALDVGQQDLVRDIGAWRRSAEAVNISIGAGVDLFGGGPWKTSWHPGQRFVQHQILQAKQAGEFAVIATEGSRETPFDGSSKPFSPGPTNCW